MNLIPKPKTFCPKSGWFVHNFSAISICSLPRVSAGSGFYQSCKSTLHFEGVKHMPLSSDTNCQLIECGLHGLCIILVRRCHPYIQGLKVSLNGILGFRKMYEKNNNDCQYDSSECHKNGEQSRLRLHETSHL